MADTDWIGGLTGDERFLRLPPDRRVSVYARVAANRDPTFKNKSEAEQQNLARTTLMQRGALGYDPQKVQELEGGGLQSDIFQPADVIANAAAFGLPAMGEMAAKEGTELLTKEGLTAGAKQAVGTYAGQLGSELSQRAAEPLIEKIPGQGAGGQLARGVARQAAGMLPVMAPGAVVGGGRLAGNVSAIEAGATEASEARATQLAKEELAVKNEAEGALKGVQTKTGKELGEGSKAVATEREEQAKALLPEARRQTTQQAVGRTAKETEQAMLGSPATTKSGTETLPPELIERRTKANDAAFAPVRKIGKEYGAEFNARVEGHTETPYAASTGFKSGLNGINDWIKQNAVDLSGDPAAGKLLERARKYVERKPFNPSLIGKTWQVWDDMSLDEQEAEIATYEQNRAKAFAEKGKKPPEEMRPPTGAEWKSLRSAASKLVAEGRSGASNAVGYKLRNAIEQQMADAGIPGMKDLNAKWSAYKAVFDDKFFAGVAKAQDPVDSAEHLFNNNIRSRAIINNASPDQKAFLRQLYGDAVNDAYAHGKEFVNFADQKAALDALFPEGNILRKEGTWLRLPKDEVNASEVIASNPELKGKLENKMRMYTEQEIYNRSVNIQKSIVDELTPLAQAKETQGGMQRGDSTWAANVVRQIQSLPAPEGAKLGMQLVDGVTPEDIVAAYRNEQKAPFMAAVEAVRQGKLGNVPSTLPISQGFKRRALIYGPLIAMQMGMRGYASPFYEGVFAVGGTIAGAEAVQGLIQKSFQNYLKDPKHAENLVLGIGQPTARGAIDVIAKGVTEAQINDLEQKLSGQRPGPRKDPDINDVATKPAVREGTDVRVGIPGESHSQIEDRMPPGKGKERGYVSADGKFMKRADARDAIKGMGGDPASHGPHSDELAVNANLPPNPPTPITLGNSPMQQFATQALAKAVPPQKAAIFRDYDEAARAYRKGDVAALEPREWQRKGMTPQELADGWRRSKMGRVEAGLSMLPLDQVAQAWQLASDKNDKGDAAAAARVVKQKVAEVGWQNIPQQAKAVIAPLIRRMLVPEKEEANA